MPITIILFASPSRGPDSRVTDLVLQTTDYARFWLAAGGTPGRAVIKGNQTGYEIIDSLSIPAVDTFPLRSRYIYITKQHLNSNRRIRIWHMANISFLKKWSTAAVQRPKIMTDSDREAKASVLHTHSRDLHSRNKNAHHHLTLTLQQGTDFESWNTRTCEISGLLLDTCHVI
jgi:hypothetical protein